VKVYFVPHAATTDNEAGLASGWNDPPLSERGELEAERLRDVFRGIRIDLVCCSDLQRAVDTAGIAFCEGTPVRADRRLRETNYGELNGAPRSRVDAVRRDCLEKPFPGGESGEQAVARVRECLEELAGRHAAMTLVIVGHRATRCALEMFDGGKTLADCFDETPEKRPYWEYDL
jgi:broad specificity phosphatase PhoE